MNCCIDIFIPFKIGFIFTITDVSCKLYLLVVFAQILDPKKIVHREAKFLAINSVIHYKRRISLLIK